MAMVEGSQCRKQRKQREKVAYIDWEDCIIETLLLHHVKEEEIEQGHYKRMLDLVLEGFVRKRLGAAVDQRDHSSILRFVKLFLPLGLEEEGLQVYVAYLKKVIAMRSRLEYEHLVEVMEQGGGGSEVNFVGCLMNLFRDIVLAVEENDVILRSLCGEDAISYAIIELQEECDLRGSLILKKYMEYRRLSLASDVNSYSKNLLSVAVVEGPDPKEIERYLDEILSLTQLGEDYTEFMVSKIRGLSSVDLELGPRATIFLKVVLLA
ncbi:hypothetical protein IFM89_008524 [Coptis chinensis]|uniref:COG4 transport protein middle alpha-helical bundle domain-containing protein n=1 Tax=Coptis chinensis TaxID=261450 RepID=A0A835LLT6_9MAGN|nr:hypothetical protein IFM89_008524 [Coptis chinensis]